MTHEEIQRIAEHPELADSVEEVSTLAVHLRQCDDCRRKYQNALRSEELIAAPIRRHWRHLSRRKLRKLRQSQFDPAAHRFDNVDEWHLCVCSDCQTIYNSPQPDFWSVGFNKYALAAIGLVVVGTVILWRVHSRPSDGIYRSSETIAVLQPADNATVAPLETFEWLIPNDSPSQCELRISDVNQHKLILIGKAQKALYVLSTVDAKSLVPGGAYEWYITCQSGPQAFRSQVRHFHFRGSEPRAQYRTFSEASRTALRRRVLESPDSALANILPEVNSDLAKLAIDDVADRAWLLQTRGDLFNRREMYADAVRDYQSTLALWRALGVPDKLSFSRALINSALASEELGDVDTALNGYTEAFRALKSDSANLPTLATCLLDMGRLYKYLGQIEKAKNAYEQALDVDRTIGDEGPIAEDLTNLANIVVDEEHDSRQAQRLLQEALNLQRSWAKEHRGEFRDSYSATLDGFAHAARAAGEFSLAQKYYTEAIEADTRRRSAVDVIESMNNLADLFAQDMGNPTQAMNVYRRAIRLAEASDSTNPNVTWQSYEGLGHLYLKNGMLAEARTPLARALALVSRVEGPAVPRSFRSEHAALYYDLAVLRGRESNPNLMLAAIEAIRGAGFAKEGVTPSIIALQRALRGDELLMAYRTGGKADPILLFTVSAGDVQHYELGSTAKIGDLVERCVQELRRTTQPKSTLKQLGSDLLPEAVRRRILSGSVHKLIVSLDGVLANLPVDALIIGDSTYQGYVVNRASVSVVPSITWWYELRHGGDPLSHVRGDALIMADPLAAKEGRHDAEGDAVTADLRFAPLPASRNEAKLVAQWAHNNSQEFVGERCTVRNLMGAGPSNYKILHLAVHAVSRDSPESSFLFLGLSESPTIFTGTDISRLMLKNQLVVLSACNTASGLRLAGQESDSMAYGFLRAGAAGVVATRWEIPDNDSPVLMGTFYRELSLGTSVDEALRLAKLDLITSNRSADWAAFELMGYGELRVSITPVWWRGLFNRLNYWARNHQRW